MDPSHRICAVTGNETVPEALLLGSVLCEDHQDDAMPR